MSKDLVSCIQDIYSTKDLISLHEPYFDRDEELSLESVIKSTFVSSTYLRGICKSKSSEFKMPNFFNFFDCISVNICFGNLNNYLFTLKLKIHQPQLKILLEEMKLLLLPLLGMAL